MTREETIRHLKIMQSGARNGIRFAKNDKEISEEERKEDIEIYQDQLMALTIAIEALKQEPKIGYWVWLTEDKYRCSNCNHETRVDECMNEPMYDFCPFCGAKMESEE